MPFKKGNKLAVGPRPKKFETNSASGDKLLSGIRKFLEKNMLTTLEDMETPGAREKARIYCYLLNYAVPRLTPRSGEIKFEDMNEAQLNRLLNILQDNALPRVLKKRESRVIEQ